MSTCGQWTLLDVVDSNKVRTGIMESLCLFARLLAWSKRYLFPITGCFVTKVGIVIHDGELECNEREREKKRSLLVQLAKI